MRVYTRAELCGVGGRGKWSPAEITRTQSSRGIARERRMAPYSLRLDLLQRFPARLTILPRILKTEVPEGC